MMILNGKEVVNDLKKQLKEKFDDFYESTSIMPCLAVLTTSNDEASKVYLKARKKICDEMGVQLIVSTFEATPTQEQVIERVIELNMDSSIHGIMIDRPLGNNIDEQAVFSVLDSHKDIDCCGTIGVGKLMLGISKIAPCTAVAVLELLKAYHIDLIGKHIVVVGRSRNVGLPLFHLLLQENATVTMTHSKTQNLKKLCQFADIVIVAIGKKYFITRDYVLAKTIIIDVGIHYDEQGRVVGDVDPEVYELVHSYSPVPGGVGPLTNYALMKNLLTIVKGVD